MENRMIKLITLNRMLALQYQRLFHMAQMHKKRTHHIFHMWFDSNTIFYYHPAFLAVDNIDSVAKFTIILTYLVFINEYFVRRTNGNELNSFKRIKSFDQLFDSALNHLQNRTFTLNSTNPHSISL